MAYDIYPTITVLNDPSQDGLAVRVRCRISCVQSDNEHAEPYEIQSDIYARIGSREDPYGVGRRSALSAVETYGDSLREQGCDVADTDIEAAIDDAFVAVSAEVFSAWSVS